MNLVKNFCKSYRQVKLLSHPDKTDCCDMGKNQEKDFRVWGSGLVKLNQHFPKLFSIDS